MGDLKCEIASIGDEEKWNGVRRSFKKIGACVKKRWSALMVRSAMMVRSALRVRNVCMYVCTRFLYSAAIAIQTLVSS